MDIEEFLTLPAEDIAYLMHSSGPKVCVFPINGTRRWFLLEYPPQTWNEKSFLDAFHEQSVRRQLDLFKLLFDHGVDLLMMPLAGPDIMERGPEYQEMMADMLVELAEAPHFLDFYETYGVRVRFYGDYRKYFAGTPLSKLCDVFDRLAERTRHYDRFRLFYGLFAQDPAETVGELSVKFYQQNGALPDKRKLVELYYGEQVPPVSLFIGFDKFCAFDMPLVATGNEDLYFTASPSFYMTQNQLRLILFDHLFSRRMPEQNYETLAPEAVEWMRTFYRVNQEVTLGVGAIRDGFWYPLSGLKTLEPIKPDLGGPLGS